jgi:hypothetical protein
MVEAMRLKIMALRSPSVASPAYQISWKSTIPKVVKRYT